MLSSAAFKWQRCPEWSIRDKKMAPAIEDGQFAKRRWKLASQGIDNTFGETK
jgi:hypothetical protein